MTTKNIYELAQTWNNVAETFTAIKMNVTDTASASDSKLLDLQLGGVSILSVGKAAVNVPAGTSQVPGLRVGTGNNGFASISNTEITGVVGGSNVMRLQSSMCIFNSPIGIGGGFNLYLHNDAANTLAQRNGANAQAFNIYNTYTNASNYERGSVRWSSNVLEIGTEAAGTGAQRDFLLFRGSSSLRLGSSQLTVSGVNIVPWVAGAIDLGAASNTWRNIFLRPSASLTPSDNGGLCIEATNNTTLTFKLKGSDGTVRSGTVTLA